MENQKHLLTLLLILGACAGTSTIQAAIADAVVAWGDNEYGQTTVPLAAQSGVKAIAAGEAHTVALKNDGTVVAWGWNVSGQVTGIPSHDEPYTAIGNPVTLGGEVLSGVTAIAAGYDYTVALKNDGTVVAWGANNYGQVTGIPTPAAPYSATTRPISQNGQVLGGVTAIAAGGSRVVALKNDGSVVAWGGNVNGQTTVPVAAQSGVTAIAAGEGPTVALKADGSVVSWGTLESARSVPFVAQSGVRAIAAGHFHIVALKNDGSVVAWGENDLGQTTVPAGLSGVTAIAAGAYHTVALKNDGSVVMWGKIYDRPDFVLVPAIPPADLSGATAIVAGAYHTVALVVPIAPTISTQPTSQATAQWQRASFTVTTTGYPLAYQWRKDGVDVAGATSATYIVPFAQTNQAGNYTVVVNNIVGSVTSAPPAVLTVNPTSPGAVVAWGDNKFGQTTVPVAAQSGVTAIAAGYGHTVALKSDGTLVVWGANEFGQVTGIPTPDEPSTAIANPVTLRGQVLRDVTAIAAGASSTWAVKSDGTVVAWGWTGISNPDDPSTAIANPVTLGEQVLSGVTAIAAGIFALKSDGSAVRLGGTMPVAAQNGVAAIAGGWSSGDPGVHHVALKRDGTVVAWGANPYGEVTGTSAGYTLADTLANPVTLGGQVLRGVTAIAAGAHSTFAVKDDGTVVQWGFTIMDVPAGLSGVMAIASGAVHIVALKHDGSVVAWGNNIFGSTDVPSGLNGVTAIAAGAIHTVALLGTAVTLQARRSGNTLILWWPASATGFTLQLTLSLTPPVTWIDSTPPPAVIGTQFTVTNTNSGSAQF